VDGRGGWEERNPYHHDKGEPGRNYYCVFAEFILFKKKKRHIDLEATSPLKLLFFRGHWGKDAQISNG